MNKITKLSLIFLIISILLISFVQAEDLKMMTGLIQTIATGSTDLKLPQCFTQAISTTSQPCPTNHNAIMYLNQKDNAHGYFNSGTATTHVLCCGGKMKREENVKLACNKGKVLVWLNQKNNAHGYNNLYKNTKPAIIKDLKLLCLSSTKNKKYYCKQNPKGSACSLHTKESKKFCDESKSGMPGIPVCLTGVSDCKTGTKPPSSEYIYVIGLNQKNNAHFYGSKIGYKGSGKTNIYCKPLIEKCNNGIDDDENGKIDCEDSFCKGKVCDLAGSVCSKGICTEALCTDGKDNDANAENLPYNDVLYRKAKGLNKLSVPTKKIVKTKTAVEVAQTQGSDFVTITAVTDKETLTNIEPSPFWQKIKEFFSGNSVTGKITMDASEVIGKSGVRTIAKSKVVKTDALPSKETSCTNKLDDDKDGQTDCNDNDCYDSGKCGYEVKCTKGAANGITVRRGYILDQIGLKCMDQVGDKSKSNTAGGSGGTPGSVTCPAGKYLTGIQFYLGNHKKVWYPTKLQAICDGSPYGKEFGKPQGALFGTNRKFIKKCPSGQYVKSIKGQAGKTKFNENTFIYSIANVICGSKTQTIQKPINKKCEFNTVCDKDGGKMITNLIKAGNSYDPVRSSGTEKLCCTDIKLEQNNKAQSGCQNGFPLFWGMGGKAYWKKPTNWENSNTKNLVCISGVGKCFAVKDYNSIGANKKDLKYIVGMDKLEKGSFYEKGSIYNIYCVDGKGKDCKDTDCSTKLGPNKHTCCYVNSECKSGATCNNNQCEETSCINGIDDDGDGLIDCQEAYCNGLTCSGDKKSICINKVCTKIPDAKKAAKKQEVAKIQIFSYLEILKMMNKCKVKTGSVSTCSKICSSKENGFPTKWKDKTITRCTCC